MSLKNTVYASVAVLSLGLAASSFAQDHDRSRERAQDRIDQVDSDQLVDRDRF